MDGTVERRRKRGGRWSLQGVDEWAAEKENSAGTRPSLFLGEMRGITVAVKDHAAGVEAKNGVGMRGAIVEELGDRNGGSGRAIGLSRGERAKGDEQACIRTASSGCSSKSP